MPLSTPIARTLFLTGTIDNASVGTLIKSVVEINTSDALLIKEYAQYDIVYDPKPIQLYINSGGGHVTAAFGAVDVIAQSKTPVHTIGTGIVMSAAILVLIAGHRRRSYKHTSFMIHSVSVGMRGTLPEVKHCTEEVERLQNVATDMIVARTSIARVVLVAAYQKILDWYFDTDGALEYGIVDEIIA